MARVNRLRSKAYAIPRIPKALDGISGVACLVLLAVAAWRHWSESDDVRLNPNREAAIRAAFADLPDLLGEEGVWIRTSDSLVAPSQASMLGLSAYVNRGYQRLGIAGVRARLFFAHSSDARSMAGHHPPNCYPAAGWELLVPNGELIALKDSNGNSMPARLYQFVGGDAEASPLWVVNGFLLPGGGGVASLEEAGALMKSAKSAQMGLTQFQIVFRGDLNIGEVTQYALELLSSLPRALYESLGARFVDRENNVNGGRM